MWADVPDYTGSKSAIQTFNLHKPTNDELGTNEAWEYYGVQA